MKTTLADLVDTLGSSLHSYVAAAGVWSFPGDEAIKLAIVDLVDDQRSLADRAGRLLAERGETPPSPVFPIRYTATHDVDLGAMLPRVLEGLRRQIGRLQRLVDAGGAPGEIELVLEAREASLQHADVLEELARGGRSGAKAPATAP
jgi:hypothetical protein